MQTTQERLSARGIDLTIVLTQGTKQIHESGGDERLVAPEETFAPISEGPDVR